MYARELDLEVTSLESCQNHNANLVSEHLLLSLPSTDATASASVMTESRNWTVPVLIWISLITCDLNIFFSCVYWLLFIFL